jgi:hypothetical protein
MSTLLKGFSLKVSDFPFSKSNLSSSTFNPFAAPGNFLLALGIRLTLVLFVFETRISKENKVTDDKREKTQHPCIKSAYRIAIKFEMFLFHGRARQ